MSFAVVIMASSSKCVSGPKTKMVVLCSSVCQGTIKVLPDKMVIARPTVPIGVEMTKCGAPNGSITTDVSCLIFASPLNLANVHPIQNGLRHRSHQDKESNL